MYKCKNKHIFINYRPISLLPQFSKILEKLFKTKLDTFIEKHSILNDSQYGFRSNRSTSLALLEITEQITSSLVKKLCTVGVFIDLKKAFDTINQGLLLKKLYHYGIRGTSNDWLASYLDNRFQYVSFDNCASDSQKVICGVPQGYILGHKLFILYINDIRNISTLLNFVPFADDTNLFCACADPVQLSNDVSRELNKLNTWFSINNLSLNLSKTSFMLFTNRNRNTKIQISMNNNKINEVCTTKFLGVLIDHNLHWKDHICTIRSKLSKNIRVIRRAKNTIEQQM